MANTNESRRSYLRKTLNTSSLIGIGVLGLSTTVKAEQRHITIDAHNSSDNGTYYLRVSSGDLTKGSYAEGPNEEGHDNIVRKSNYSYVHGTLENNQKDDYYCSGDISQFNGRPGNNTSTSSGDFILTVDSNLRTTSRNRLTFKIDDSGDGKANYSFTPTGNAFRTGWLEDNDKKLGSGGGGYLSANGKDVWKKTGQLEGIVITSGNTSFEINHWKK